MLWRYTPLPHSSIATGIKILEEAAASSILEVVWAPVLLMHLGGQDCITAYNMEDNEPWMRHVATAVSQITIAVYVFIKSWQQGGDKKLLQAAIMLFFVGIVKYLEKPWALKSASINSLVSSDDPAERRANRGAGGTNPLDSFVQQARELVCTRVQEEEGEVQGLVRASVDHSQAQEGRITISPQAQTEAGVLSRIRKALPLQKRNGGTDTMMHINHPSELFVDLAYPYPHRLSVLQSFSGLNDEKAFLSLQRGLRDVFSLLYTKLKSSGFRAEMEMLRVNKMVEDGKTIKATFTLLRNLCSLLIRLSRMVLPFAAIGLFHTSHREAYNGDDVKITYALFVCGSLLEVYSMIPMLEMYSSDSYSKPVWLGMVAQYSLIGFFARNMKHSKKMRVVSFFGCKDYLDQQWCMKSCFSSGRITLLVLRHLKNGWMRHIQDAVSYWKFNDHRGQGTLEVHQRNEDLGWSLQGPFDESVLLWHIATDICFYSSRSCIEHTCTLAEDDPAFWSILRQIFLPKFLQKIWSKIQQEFEGGSASSNHQTGPQCGTLTECQAVRSRQISNYMVYLLFVKPEMLLPGSRRNLFTTAYDELKEILKEDKPESAVQRKLSKLKSIGDNEKPQVDEEGHMQRIISKMKSMEGSELNKLKSMEGSKKVVFIPEAWNLAEGLLGLRDEEKMWKVIQGVWVEMLCFSASRCRGYLHAKALGTGGEFLSYVWLLMSHMGMETFAERLQRDVPIPGEGGNTSDAPWTSELHTGGGAPPAPGDLTSAAPSTSKVPTVAHLSTSEVPSGAIASSSEIRVATGDDMV